MLIDEVKQFLESVIFKLNFVILREGTFAKLCNVLTCL